MSNIQTEMKSPLSSPHEGYVPVSQALRLVFGFLDSFWMHPSAGGGTSVQVHDRYRLHER